MSTTVDNRVVKMTFDNKSFEKGVDDTLKTIDKLNKKLEFKDASNGFDNIEQAANNVNLKNLESNIQSLADRFSGLGIIGMQIWSKIGDSIWDLVTGPFKKLSSVISGIENQIKTGGWNRAANLDKAKNMLINLGQGYDSAQKSADTLGTTMKDGVKKPIWNRYKAIDDAVNGTAYSFDEAAMAVAGFIAVNEDMTNEDLTKTLRAAQGVASTYSKDLSQIAVYLQKIQGQGGLTKGIVSDMKMANVSIEPIIKDYLGITNATAEQMDELYKSNAITFDMVIDALYSKFSDSLDKANQTYEGATNNMRSAMSRIGAAFYEPMMDSLIKGANQVRVFMNGIKDVVTKSGFAETISGTVEKAINKIDELFFFIDEKGNKKLNKNGSILIGNLTNYFKGFSYIVKSVVEILSDFGKAFYEVFLKGADDGAKKSGNFIKKMQELFDTIVSHREEIINAFKGFLYVLKPIIKLIGVLLKIAFKLLGLALKGIAIIAGLLGNLITLVVESKAFNAVLDAIHKSLSKVSEWLSKVINFIVEFFKELKLGEKIATGFHNLIDAIKTFYQEYQPFDKVLNVMKGSFDNIRDAIDFLIEKFEELTGIHLHIPTFDEIADKAKEVKDTIVAIFNDPKGAADTFMEKLSEVKDFLGNQFSKVVDEINEKFKTFKKWLTGFTGGFDDAKKSMEDFSKSKGLEETEKKVSVLDTISKALDNFGKALELIWNTFKTIGSYIVDGLKWAFDQVSDLTGIESFKDFLGVLKDLVGILIRYNWAKAAASFGQFFGILGKTFKQNMGMASTTGLKTLPNALLKIAVAMGVLTLSVIALSQLDTEDIVQAELALAGIVALAGLLVKVMSAAKNLFIVYDAEGNIVTKTKKTFAEKLSKEIVSTFGKAANLAALGVFITSIATALLEVMAGITLLSKVLQDKEGKINKDALIAAVGVMLVVLGALFLALHFMVKEVQNFKKESLDDKTNTLTEIQKSGSWSALLGLSAFLISLTDVVLIITSAVALLSLIPEENLIRGGTVLAIILAALVAIMGIATFFTQNTKNSTNGDGKILKSSSGGNGGALAGLAAFLVALSAAVMLIVPSLVVLGMLKEKVFWQGVRGILVIGAVLALCLWVVSKAQNGLSGAGVVLSIMLAIVASAFALDKIGKVKHLTKATIAIAVIGLIIAVLMALAGKLDFSYQAALTVISIAAALYIAALAVKKMSDIEWKKDWWISLVVIGAFIVALLGLAALTHVVPGLKIALGVVGASMLGAGAGIFLFVAALTMLVPLIEEVYDKKDELAGKIGAFCDIIADTIVGLFLSILEAFRKKVNGFIDSAGGLLLAILSGIASFLLDHHKEIGETIGNFFAAVVIIVVEAIATFCGKIVDALRENFGIGEDGASSSWANVGSGLIKGLAIGLDFVGTTLEDAMDAIANFLDDVIDDPDHAWEGIGSSLVQSLINGLNMMYDALTSALAGVFDTIDDYMPGPIKRLLFPEEWEREHKKAVNDMVTVMKNAQKDLVHSNATALSESLGISGTNLSGESSYDDLNEYATNYKAAIDNAQKAAKVIAENQWTWDKDFGKNSKATFWLSMYNTSIAQAQQAFDDYQDRVEHLANAFETDQFRISVWRGDYDEKGFQKFVDKYIDISEVAYYTLGEASVEAYRNGLMRNGALSDKTNADWLEDIYKNSSKAIGSVWSKGGTAPIKTNGKSSSFENLGAAASNSFVAGLGGSLGKANQIFGAAISGIEQRAATAKITPVFDYTTFQNEADSLAAAMAALNTDVQIQVDLMNQTNQSQMNDLVARLNATTNDTVNSALLTQITSQNGIISGLSDKIDKISVYLDGDTLVGGIASRMDKSIGSRMLLVGRSVIT